MGDFKEIVLVGVKNFGSKKIARNFLYLFDWMGVRGIIG
jgi:hypothetical protein